jgi:hypothetical protein
MDDGDKRLAIVGMIALAGLALVALFMLLFFNRGSDVGLGVFGSAATTIIGALAMYVRPLN